MPNGRLTKYIHDLFHSQYCLLSLDLDYKHTSHTVVCTETKLHSGAITQNLSNDSELMKSLLLLVLLYRADRVLRSWCKNAQIDPDACSVYAWTYCLSKIGIRRSADTDVCAAYACYSRKYKYIRNDLTLSLRIQ
jgi:hypothetical protein